LVDYERLNAFLQKNQIHHVTGMDHIKRVHDICLKIAKKTNNANIDYDVLRVAAYLHDCAVPVSGSLNHHEKAAQTIGNLLEEIGLPPEKQTRVLEAIRTHSRQKKGLVPETLEAQILKDADGIDGIGAVGILRAVLRSYGNQSYDGDVNKNGVKLVNSRMLNIQGSDNAISTEVGKRMAEEKIRFHQLFMKTLEEELTETNEEGKEL